MIQTVMFHSQRLDILESDVNQYLRLIASAREPIKFFKSFHLSQSQSLNGVVDYSAAIVYDNGETK